MGARDWFRPPRQILTIFLAVALVSAGALAWLSWQLVAQDRAAVSERHQDAREQAADRAVASMQRALADLQAAVGVETPVLPPGVLAVSLGPDRVIVRPANGLLYHPVLPARASIPSPVLTEGERFEFIARDLPAAKNVYARLATSPDVGTRAAALLRLARVSRKLNATREALGAYDDLAKLGPTPAEGLPSALAARVGRMSVFEETSRAADLGLEAKALLRDLQQARWPVTKAVYETYVAEARRSVTDASSDDPDAVGRAEAVNWLWNHRDGGEGSARQLLSLETGPALVVWASRATGVDAVVVGRAYLAALCGEAFSAETGWSLSDLNGRLMLGQVPPDRRAAVRTAVTAGLPWTLHVFPPSEALATPSPRRTLVLVIGLVTVVLAAGWYFIFRSLGRERRVAELQSDFVAAVSHEFRSPLTSLSHAADLLAHDRLDSDDLRRQSYEVLVREAARLRGLVEGLLDFGRFETGASAFRFDEVDIGALVRDTVADFQDRVVTDGFRIELTGAGEVIHARADREALSRALWNLLDNAVKYSPDCRTVWVNVEPHPHRVSITVRDQGIGIPLDEQLVIFDRFVRGEESKLRRIRGTGIGLAMVKKIARAHRGDVVVLSEPGKGSRFTLVLQTEGAR